ncbi:MAG TPA: ribosome maturation factor RimM [Bacteroidia bacterium]|nr:ribosome maturation factor RimM [Bacteroidia bacterium]
MKQNDFTEIGFIRKANGFKGEVILALHSENAEDISNNKFLFIDMDGSMVPFLVEKLSDESGNIIVKLEDVDTHESASALLARIVYLPTDELSESTEENSFSDLTGYAVIDKVKGLLGTVKSASEMPGQFIICFEYSGAEVLLPLHKETLLKIAKKKKELHVKLPDGLLEVYIKNKK